MSAPAGLFDGSGLAKSGVICYNTMDQKNKKPAARAGEDGMEDLLLQEARERGLADERGLYLAANVVADGKQLGRVWAFLNGSLLYLAELEFPAGLGDALLAVELRGAKATVQRFLVPLSLSLDTPQGRFEFKGFRGAKEWLAAVLAAC